MSQDEPVEDRARNEGDAEDVGVHESRDSRRLDGPGEPGRRRGAQLCNRLLHNCWRPFAAGGSGRKLCSRSLHNLRGFRIADWPDPSNRARGACTIPPSPRIVPPDWVLGHQGLRKSRYRRTEPGLAVQSGHGVRGIGHDLSRSDPERWTDQCTRKAR